MVFRFLQIYMSILSWNCQKNPAKLESGIPQIRDLGGFFDYPKVPEFCAKDDGM